MKFCKCSGLTLVELLVAMMIASITGVMVMQMVINFQSRAFAEISRNDLQDRAERLIRFVANDIGDSSFLFGPVPTVADGHPLFLNHDSLPGDPVESLPFSIITEDAVANDRITFVKAESFAPPVSLALSGISGDQSLLLNRRPNVSPGSSREIQVSPEAINHIGLANHRLAYRVLQAEQELHIAQPLQENVPAGTELLGLRVYSYYLDPFSGSHRLRRDNWTSRNILDDAIDGLQFEYLMVDGSLVSQPTRAQDVRGIKVSLLVRDLRKDPSYKDEKVYSLGNHTYGPFGDHCRRYVSTQLIEVKNHGFR